MLNHNELLRPFLKILKMCVVDLAFHLLMSAGLISPVTPTVTPTPAAVPASAPADLLESGFDAFATSPVSATPAAADSAPATAAPSGGFDASGEKSNFTCSPGVLSRLSYSHIEH